MIEQLKRDIFKIQSDNEFLKYALDIFRHQAKNNPVYAKYLSLLKTDIDSVKSLEQIPFLPIEFFKSQKVCSTSLKEQIIFTSSGTSGMSSSKHYVSDLSIYEDSFIKGFEQYYGAVEDYCVLALLPSYMEREGSSLIYMMEKMVEVSKHAKSGFYLYNHNELIETIAQLKKENKKILLLGVSFALLDLAEKFKVDFSDVIIMETGGMKGRRKEITREELHSILCDSFNVEKIHSEYGMTELLSQAYSKGASLFNTPAWMRILIRETTDPFSYQQQGLSGGLNIIDLANIDSCSFIETQDLGKIHADNSFEILGRFDNTDVRGCNLLVVE